MKYRLFWVMALSALVATTSYAKCEFLPDIQADVEVGFCVAVVLGSSEARVSSRDFGASGDKSYPAYKEGSSLSGTLLSVRVRKSHVVSGNPRSDPWPNEMRKWLRSWAPGQGRDLFVAKPPSEVCPGELYSNLRVVTGGACCDVLPYADECLLPSSLTRVGIVSR